MKNKHILIVDDDPSVRFLLKFLLEKKTCKVETASNGLIAIEKISRDYDLIITDRHMPKMDGEELLHQVQKIGLSPKVILLSGSLNNGEADELLKFGFDAVEEKPIVNIDYFLSLVRQLLG